MRRRDFVAFLASVAAGCIPARAQQGRKRRIGVLIGLAAGDPAGERSISKRSKRPLALLAGGTDKTFKSTFGQLLISKLCSHVRPN